MLTTISPYEGCPCGSNKKAKFCCLDGKRWDKKPVLLRKADNLSGYSHPKCYASEINNCSTKISGEHYISNNILADFEHNKTVKIVGLPWQENEVFNLLSRKALVSNILCTTHNELLSPLDSEMGRFFRTIKDYDERFNEPNPQSELAVFCGEDLERWMLKTVCAFIKAGLIVNNGEKVECKLKDEYVDILFNGKPFPEHWGMYYHTTGIVQKYHSFSFRPLTVNGEIKAAEFLINNFKFYLVLCIPDLPKQWGTYRPRGMQFRNNEITKTVEICWQDKKYDKGLFFDRAGTTKEQPQEWDEYLKK